MRICDSCLEKHLKQVEAFDRNKPEATADEWARFWDRNIEWQKKRMAEHCEQARR